MVNKCCIPNCTTNYRNSKKGAVFSFPKNEDLKKIWLRAIKRNNYQPSKHSRVCELHYTDKDICRTAEMYEEKSGKKIVVNLMKPRLYSGAIPSVFPNCPSYLSAPKHSRESVDKKRLRIENRHIECTISESIRMQSEYEKKYMFSDFSEFLTCLSNDKVSGEWITIKKDNVVIFVVIAMSSTPEILVSATFDNNLELKLFQNHNELTKYRGETYPKKFNNIKDIFAILKEFENYSSIGMSFEDVCQNAITMLQNSYKKHDELINKKIDFFCEQLALTSVKKEMLRYSAEYLIYFSLLYSISPHAYRYIRSTGFLNIPHPKTVTKICSKFNCNPKDEISNLNFLRYTKQKFQLLSNSDIIVSLMIDEIHIKPYFDYKAGNIVGMSCNSQGAATTAYVFMIQSLKSSYKDVVHILPVNNINGEDLNKYIKKVIIGLHLIGFNVVCVVSDNNAVNKKAMSYFNSPPKFNIVYKHPADQNKPLFFVFDSVHTLKCIRNNWLNQKNQTFIYPKIDQLLSSSCSEVANFNLLKTIYNLENSSLVKYAHTLNAKSLNPSNFERQNVKLALNIFNEHVHNAILFVGSQNNLAHYNSTAAFIETIIKWWNTVNVKTLYKDKRLRNNYMSPLSPNQENYNYLVKCLTWLDHWANCQVGDNRLTKQTHLAFTHTTYALIQLTDYCVNELNFKFLLPGKIQTDSLEDRFGKYRGMAGSQYLISMRQIFEIESKLRVQSLLPLTLKSHSFGPCNIDITDITNNIPDEQNDSCSSVTEHINFNICVSEQDIITNQTQLPILTYIAGYCTQKLLKKLCCKYCNNYLNVSKEQINVDLNSNYELIRSLDRGGLLLPHNDVVNLVLFTYIVVNKLISEEFEQEFLNCQNHRNVVINITSSIVACEDFFLSDFNCNIPEHSLSTIMFHLIKTSANILLNNYIKKKNDIISIKTLKNKRKLSTVSK